MKIIRITSKEENISPFTTIKSVTVIEINENEAIGLASEKFDDNISSNMLNYDIEIISENIDSSMIVAIEYTNNYGY